MKVKIVDSAEALPCEGPLPGILKSITPKGDKSCVFVYTATCEKGDLDVSKLYKLEFKPKTPLYKDCETINGKSFTKEELGEEFDLNSLVGKPCTVVVEHKRASGGKLKAIVNQVLPAEAT